MILTKIDGYYIVSFTYKNVRVNVMDQNRMTAISMALEYVS